MTTTTGETEYRLIRGWYADGRGKLFRRCKRCGCFVDAERFPPSHGRLCPTCYNDYQREKRTQQAREDALRRDADMPICKYCKSYSSVSDSKCLPERGWCLRHKRSVYASSGCAEHRYINDRRGCYYEMELKQR